MNDTNITVHAKERWDIRFSDIFNFDDEIKSAQKATKSERRCIENECCHPGTHRKKKRDIVYYVSENDVVFVINSGYLITVFPFVGKSSKRNKQIVERRK